MKSAVLKPILRVAIPVPIRRLFDYFAPDECTIESLLPGMRVLVPFGQVKKIGIIVAVQTASDYPLNKLKPVLAVLDELPLFPKSLLQLIEWASHYYQQPIGEVFEAVLPNPLRKEQPPHKKSYQSKIEKIMVPLESAQKPFLLNTHQQKTIETLTLSLNQFKTFLLNGVTGSGKTEIYMQMIEKAIAAGLQTLILIPEIGLTPQLLQRFQTRFQVPIAVLNSSLTDKKRLDAWEMARTGKAPIVIGTRLAVFTPLLKPGVFIMDEEHDASFKQQDNFRYHARDLLILRASLENCPVILGSATPSLETLHNAEMGKFHTLKLPLRAGKATFPSVQILDIRHKKLEEGLSAQLIEMIRTHTQNKNQVLLFLNRRGFAPVFMCFTCGWVASCKNCDAKLTLHYQAQKLECHHCQAVSPLYTECPSCHHPNPKPVGIGTERVEAVLKDHFPDLNIDRIDRDTTRKKGSIEEAMARLHRQETDILLGTQMIAKGHHLPHITLVAILDVDHALFSTDFRSLEKMGQLITQVAGRTGRAEKPGHVVLQTAHPEHPLLKMILEEGYLNFANALLTERKATNLPPYSYQALIRAEAKQPQVALDFLTRIKKSIETNPSKTFKILGPIPAPMERRQQQHRAQLLLQAPKRSSLQTLLSKLIEKMNEDPNQKKIRWSLDVDPIDLY